MFEKASLRSEVADRIAGKIAADHCPWQIARQNALDELEREYGRIPTNAIPDSSEVETAVRAHYAIFEADEHRTVLKQKRQTALAVMRKIENLNPWLFGAVLNGAAHEDSNICLAVFVDDIKFSEVSLMEARFDFEAIDAPLGDKMPLPLECLGFLYFDRQSRLTEGVCVYVYDSKTRGLNPYRRKPDCYQSSWEAAGRINIRDLEVFLSE